MSLDRRDVINLLSKILSFVINVLVSFFLTSYIVSTVGEEAYGFVGLANDFVSYISILTISINSMASRFVTIEIEKRRTSQVNQLMSSILFVDVIVSALMSIIGTIFIMNFQFIININTNLLPDVRILWFFLLATFLLDLINVVFSIAPFAKNRLDLEALRSTESLVLKAVVLFIAYYFFPSTVWYVGLGALLQSLYAFLYNIKYTRKFLPELTLSVKQVSFRKIAELFRSGFWNSFTKLGVILRSGFDLLIANLFVGAQYMGVLSLTKIIPQQVLNLFNMMASVFMPKLIISFAHEDFKEMKKQLTLAMRLLGLFSTLPLVLIFCFGADLYSLWLPNQNSGLLQGLTVAACIPFIVLLPLEPLWNLFTALNKLRVTSIYLVAEAAVSLLITVILVQFCSGWHEKLFVIVSVSAIFELIRSLIFLPLYAGYCLGRKYGFIYKLIGLNIVMFVLNYLVIASFKILFPVSGWFSLIFEGVLASIFVVLIELRFAINKSERRFLFNKISSMVKR